MCAGLWAKISARSRYLFERLELKSAERSVIFGTPRCVSGQSGRHESFRSMRTMRSCGAGGCRLEIDSPSRASAAKVDKAYLMPHR